MKLAMKLILCVCLALTINCQRTGFILTDSSDVSSASDSVTYGDNDINNLILHNLGLLNNQNDNNDLTTSSKSLINNYGIENTIFSSKINYLFALETSSSNALANILRKPSNEYTKAPVAHKEIQTKICSGDACVFDMLYTQESNSLYGIVDALVAGNPTTMGIYASGDILGSEYKNSRLILSASALGGISLYDESTKQTAVLKESLAECIHDAFGDKYLVDLSTRTILTNNSTSFMFSEKSEAAFNDFMQDICAMNAISSLIHKGEQPVMLSFYINSISELEADATEEQKAHIYAMFKLAYNKFIANLEGQFNRNEMTGEVLTISPKNTLSKRYNKLDIRSSGLSDVRILASTGQDAEEEEENGENSGETISSGKQVQKMFIIPFMIIGFLILIGLFNMEVYRDTLVYAKFINDNHKA